MSEIRFQLNEKGESSIGTMSILVSFNPVGSEEGVTIINSGMDIQSEAECTYTQAINEVITGLNVFSINGDMGRDSNATNTIDPYILNVGNGDISTITTRNDTRISESWRITITKEIKNSGIFRMNSSKIPSLIGGRYINLYYPGGSRKWN